MWKQKATTETGDCSSPDGGSPRVQVCLLDGDLSYICTYICTARCAHTIFREKHNLTHREKHNFKDCPTQTDSSVLLSEKQLGNGWAWHLLAIQKETVPVTTNLILNPKCLASMENIWPPPLRATTHSVLLLPPNRLRPSFFAIFFKRLDKNQRNFRSEYLRTCPNFHYLDILLSHKYFRHFPLTRNVNFQAADSLGE